MSRMLRPNGSVGKMKRTARKWLVQMTMTICAPKILTKVEVVLPPVRYSCHVGKKAT